MWAGGQHIGEDGHRTVPSLKKLLLGNTAVKDPNVCVEVGGRGCRISQSQGGGRDAEPCYQHQDQSPPLVPEHLQDAGAGLDVLVMLSPVAVPDDHAGHVISPLLMTRYSR